MFRTLIRLTGKSLSKKEVIHINDLKKGMVFMLREPFPPHDFVEASDGSGENIFIATGKAIKYYGGYRIQCEILNSEEGMRLRSGGKKNVRISKVGGGANRRIPPRKTASSKGGSKKTTDDTGIKSPTKANSTSVSKRKGSKKSSTTKNVRADRVDDSNSTGIKKPVRSKKSTTKQLPRKNENTGSRNTARGGDTKPETEKGSKPTRSTTSTRSKRGGNKKAVRGIKKLASSLFNW